MSQNLIYPFEVEANMNPLVPVRFYPKVIWIMGLSGSGKSTIAKEIKDVLEQKGIVTALLDGDNLRFGLNNNLGFTDEDRIENVRRAAEVATLMLKSRVCVICCLITPKKEAQEIVQSVIPSEKLFAVYLSTSLEKGFTGIDSAFDVPSFAHFTLDNTHQSVQESVNEILNNIQLEKHSS